MSALTDKLNLNKKPEASKPAEIKKPEIAEPVATEPVYKAVFASRKGYQVAGELMRPDVLGYFSPKNEKQKAFCEKKVAAKEFVKV